MSQPQVLHVTYAMDILAGLALINSWLHILQEPLTVLATIAALIWYMHLLVKWFVSLVKSYIAWRRKTK